MQKINEDLKQTILINDEQIILGNVLLVELNLNRCQRLEDIFELFQILLKIELKIKMNDIHFYNYAEVF